MANELRIPSPPQALTKVIQTASDPRAPTVAVAKAVSSEPGLSVQLLRIVNSSVYRRGVAISTVERAVAMLGNRALRNLALCVAVQNCVRGKIGKFDLNRFWEDSLRRAVAARILADRFAAAEVDPTEAFTFGLLQDLGVLALVQTKPEHIEAWMAAAGRLGDDRRLVEQKTFGIAHDEVAEQLISVWSLPPELATPMRYHHRPAAAPPEYRRAAQIAGQAELLAQVLSATDKRAALGAARAGLAREANLDAETVDQLVDQVSASVDEVAGELGFRVGRQPTMEEILSQANAGLVELNLTYEEVVRRLERTLAEKEELAQQLAARNRELEQLSITDALTNLPNRRALSGRLTYELGRIAGSGGSIAFVMGDLDRFKSVNDTWGHEFGDAVLKAAAKALRTAARASDLVARIGGEEFGTVLVDVDLATAQKIADALRLAVAEVRTPCPDGQTRTFTISLGLAWIGGTASQKFDADAIAATLYRTADRALYDAKEAGRNRVCVAPSVVGWGEAPARAA